MSERGERVYGEKSPIYSPIEPITGQLAQGDVSIAFEGTMTIRTSYKNRQPISSYPVIKIPARYLKDLRNTLHSEEGVEFICDIIINNHGTASAQLICGDEIQVFINGGIRSKE